MGSIKVFVEVIILVPIAFIIILCAAAIPIGIKWEKEAKIRKEAKRQAKVEEERRKADQRRQLAYERAVQNSWSAINKRTPEGFNRELTQALSVSNVNRAVKLVSVLLEPINSQAIEIIRTIDSLKKAGVSAAAPGDLKTLVKVMTDGAADLETDLLNHVTWVFRIMKTSKTSDYNELRESAKSAIILHSNQLKEILDRARKALVYVRDTTSNLSISEESAGKSAWINNYPPIGDPGPGRYLES